MYVKTLTCFVYKENRFSHVDSKLIRIKICRKELKENKLDK